MQRYKIEDMTCGHCASTVEKAIRGVDPKADINVDLRTKEVTVGTVADRAVIAQALNAAGYESLPL